MESEAGLERDATNAIAAAVQVAVVSVGMLVLYGYVVDRLGTNLLGLWSIVMAVAGLGRLGVLGFDVSTTKFVAERLAGVSSETAPGEAIGRIVDTGLYSVAVMVGIVLLIIYGIISESAFRIVVDDPNLLGKAIAILPIVFAAVWLGCVGSVYAAALDGLRLIKRRVVAYSVGIVLQLLAAVILIPRLGFVGLAWSQVFYSGAVLVVGGALYHKAVQAKPVFPGRWKWDSYAGMFGYNANVQVASMIQFISGPAIKVVLGTFGELGLVGVYEMASRLVEQLRSVVVSASRALVPTVAMEAANVERLREVYKVTYGAVFVLACFIFGGVIAASPVISRIWIGTQSWSFIWITVVLSLAWFANTVCAPAYVVNLGTGKLRWNTLSHVALGICALGFGVGGGFWLDGYGVVAGWAIAIWVGSFLIAVGHRLQHKELEGIGIPEAGGKVVLSTVIAIVAGTLAFVLMRDTVPDVVLAVIVGVVYLGITAPVLAQHRLAIGGMRRLLNEVCHDGVDVL